MIVPVLGRCKGTRQSSRSLLPRIVRGVTGREGKAEDERSAGERKRRQAPPPTPRGGMPE
jgi:hypothetical protein